MKMNLRFNAMKVAELEKTFNQPIENLVGDMRLDVIATIIAKGYYDEENDRVGVSMNVAYDKITEYLKENKNGKQDLVLDIVDELVDEGFFNQAVKEQTHKIMDQVSEEVKNLNN